MSNPITPVGRFSYPNLFKARAFEDDADSVPEYSVTLIFPDKAAVQPMLKAAEKAVTDKWPSKTLASVKNPFRQGTEKVLDDGTYPEGYSAECVFVRFARKERDGFPAPNVCYMKDGVLHHIGVSDDLAKHLMVGGSYGRVEFSPFAWDHKKGGRGVSLGLESVLFTKIGTPLATVSDPQAAFGECGDELEMEEPVDEFF